MKAVKNLNAPRLSRQKTVMLETMSADPQELEVLKTKSAETLTAVRLVKQIWPGAKVRQ